MGKFNEWQNAIEKALNHDIQEKIYYELMLAWGQKPKEPDLHFDKVALAVNDDMKKTLENYINQIDMSSES